MTEKPMSDILREAEPTIKRGLSRQDHRLIEKRFEQEFNVDSIKRKAAEKVAAQPVVPAEAQMVVNNFGEIGVAIKGARFVCRLPREYARPDTSVAIGPLGEFYVVCPGMPALLIDPATGSTRRL